MNIGPKLPASAIVDRVCGARIERFHFRNSLLEACKALGAVRSLNEVLPSQAYLGLRRLGLRHNLAEAYGRDGQHDRSGNLSGVQWMPSPALISAEMRVFLQPMKPTSRLAQREDVELSKILGRTSPHGADS
jgi:hypothetical protein